MAYDRGKQNHNTIFDFIVQCFGMIMRGERQIVFDTRQSYLDMKYNYYNPIYSIKDMNVMEKRKD
jgi:hypothetical protein